MKGSFSKNALIVYKTVFKRSNHTFQPLFILIKLLQKMLVVESGGKCSFPPRKVILFIFIKKDLSKIMNNIQQNQ